MLMKEHLLTLPRLVLVEQTNYTLTTQLWLYVPQLYVLVYSLDEPQACVALGTLEKPGDQAIVSVQTYEGTPGLPVACSCMVQTM